MTAATWTCPTLCRPKQKYQTADEYPEDARVPFAQRDNQVAAEFLPVLVGLPHPERHRQQHAFAGFGEPPGDQHAFLLGPLGRTEIKVASRNNATSRIS
jgi:hypothetical protein